MCLKRYIKQIKGLFKRFFFESLQNPAKKFLHLIQKIFSISRMLEILFQQQICLEY